MTVISLPYNLLSTPPRNTNSLLRAGTKTVAHAGVPAVRDLNAMSYILVHISTHPTRFGKVLPQSGTQDDPNAWLNDEIVSGYP